MGLSLSTEPSKAECWEESTEPSKAECWEESTEPSKAERWEKCMVAKDSHPYIICPDAKYCTDCGTLLTMWNFNWNYDGDYPLCRDCLKIHRTMKQYGTTSRAHAKDVLEFLDDQDKKQFESMLAKPENIDVAAAHELQELRKDEYSDECDD
jgi:hypothetical protein